MNIPAPSELQNPDIERIRFVTQRFTELEGLIPATFGASLIIGTLIAHVVGHAPGHEPGRLVLTTVCSMVWLSSQFHGLYRRTFGDVVGAIRRTPFSAVSASLVMCGVMADMYFPHSLNPRPSLAAVVLTMASIWIVLRDGRWRVHHLVAVAAGVAAVAVTGAVPSPDRWSFGPAGSEAHTLDLGSDTLVLVFLLALAATIDGALLPRAAPGTLAVAIGLASAWMATRDWPRRRHYLIGTVASPAAVLLGMRVDSAQALAILVLATAGAIAVEALIDARQASHDRGSASTAPV